MKYPIRWLVLLVITVTAISVYMGCATMVATEVVNDRGHPYKSHLLTDEIIAIGKPDAGLAKELGRDDCIAFLGKKNTYMLFSGGAELWQIAQLKLDADRIDTDAAESKELFLDDHRVWGKITVRYDGGKTISPEEQTELIKAGFISDNNPDSPQYHKTVSISGLLYPAIKTADEQMPKLKKHRVMKFYTNKYSGDSVLAKIAKSPLIVLGVATDTILLPVYVVGFVIAVSQ